MTIGATQAALLARPDIQAIQIHKPEPDSPAICGYKRGGQWAWYHGPTMEQAARQALHALAMIDRMRSESGR